MKYHQLFILVLCSLLFINEAQPHFNGVKNTDPSIKLIVKMIGKVEPSLNIKNRVRIANSLSQVAKKYKIDPKLMIAIIATESDFQNNKVSSTGDLSLAQINPDVWDREFKRLGLEKLNQARLKKDEVSALNKMAEILTILKNRHEKKDKHWYARYHSHNKKFKTAYRIKVQSRLKLIATI